MVPSTDSKECKLPVDLHSIATELAEENESLKQMLEYFESKVRREEIKKQAGCMIYIERNRNKNW